MDAEASTLLVIGGPPPGQRTVLRKHDLGAEPEVAIARVIEPYPEPHFVRRWLLNERPLRNRVPWSRCATSSRKCHAPRMHITHARSRPVPTAPAPRLPR